MLSLVGSSGWKFFTRMIKFSYTSLNGSSKDKNAESIDDHRTPFTLARVIGNSFESFQKNNPICFSG